MLLALHCKNSNTIKNVDETRISATIYVMSRKVDQQVLIDQLREMMLDIGRTPTRNEFVQKYSRTAVEKIFGGYTQFIHAAGLEPHKTRKIDQSIFYVKDIESHIDANDKWEVKRPNYPRMLIISDIHFPFANNELLKYFYEHAQKFKPEYVIVNGDAWDLYSHAKFPRSHNVFTPREERQAARKMNCEFWESVKKAAPNAKCIQTLGNHDVRPMKRILEVYPEAEDWIAQGLKEDFTFDGVTTIFDSRQEVIIGDIAIFHGYRSRLGEHRDFTMMNSINGHTHKGGVVFRRIRGQTLWELNSGLAGNPLAKGLTYTPQRISDWTPGFGEVSETGPRFISL